MDASMKRIVAAVAGIVAIVTLSACSTSDSEPSNEEQASATCQSAVSAKMKDPASAQFRNITIADGGTNFDDSGVYWKVSGEVNAKNGYGGMAGFSEFNCEATLPTDGDMFASYVDVD